MKYRKLPVEVEAVQWNPGVAVAGVEIVCPMGVPGDQVKLRTLEGDMDLNPGSWIVGPGAEGEYWVVKDSIFRKTYERVEAKHPGCCPACPGLCERCAI